MSTAIDERVDTTPADTDDTRPPVAHVYCRPCADLVEVAVSLCGAHAKPRSECRPWSSDTDGQECAVCYDLIDQPCQRCGS